MIITSGVIHACVGSARLSLRGWSLARQRVPTEVEALRWHIEHDVGSSDVRPPQSRTDVALLSACCRLRRARANEERNTTPVPLRL